MNKQNKAWIIAVDMGYGHQRTAYPLKDLSANDIIKANHYEGIPNKDRLIWETSREFYEFISNVKRVPLVGNFAFSLFDKFQRILSYYPRRDLSKSNANLKRIFSLIKRGWGENLIKTLSANPLPIVSTFFIPAFMAEALNYPGQIYCVICDADIARSWVSLDPAKSNIKYFAPSTWVQDRLKLYGVKEKNMYLTGYPLPKENIGRNMEIVKEDLAFRLLNLDPKKQYSKMYHPVIEDYVGELPEKSDHPLTIMFSIGGAGAQKEMCCKILKSLSKKIKNNEIKMILSAGIKKTVRDFLLDNVREVGLESELNKNIEIIFSDNIDNYFSTFNRKLRKTDILWTKPSELSFYSGLGIPIIMAPSIGSQEDFNRKWLLHIGAGFAQQNLKYTDQWLFDLLEGGRLAEGAMQGFVEIEKMGTYNIEKIISQE
ncbi:hypothetical protein KKE19_01660 [Patescibacteria group bacterium]|nr:hypothetical protein [Patescibacteria group bacterium]MBU4274499.1 hypothetical protein [Patescibacteria group bacterium]MBU4367404.1 hypothetical protein [Patescibacteria group bacterium]MBU4461724.1 hypothetical protein [Patescibacteria group bacterium]MCG2700108.1 hypothetical protein [Candidatus Parcubacteria bacterium]